MSLVCDTDGMVCQVFSEGMRRELGMTQQTIDALFPRLDDLVDIHTTFLERLMTAQNLTADRRIESIGALLQQQVRTHAHTAYVDHWSVDLPVSRYL